VAFFLPGSHAEGPGRFLCVREHRRRVYDHRLLASVPVDCAVCVSADGPHEEAVLAEIRILIPEERECREPEDVRLETLRCGLVTPAATPSR